MQKIKSFELIIENSVTTKFVDWFFSDVPSDNAGELSMIKSLRQAIDKSICLKSQNIIIGAGTSGCEAFREVSKPGNIYLFLTWQWLDCMKELAEGTIIVIPKHVFDDNFNKIEKKVTTIKIDGVLHTRTLENIKSENSKLIKDNPELILMLAGDTQQKDGKWLLYTPEMTRMLVSALPANKNIFFLNGPRTGKHKLVNGVITVDETTHRTSTDVITQYVINFISNKPWTIADFKYGETSLWGAALKFCVENPQTILILPGESTSMITETLALAIRPAIYKHAAMTDTSNKYVDNLVNNKNATLYPKLPLEHDMRQKPLELQENKIVSELCMIFSKFPNKRS